MPARKKIPEATQNQILLSCRRRCCLCFWLDGIDDVVKGQIAHLDHDPANNNPENLAFLCFNHHDEYDGSTNVSKGLQRAEVMKWRDELYAEMEYRFRTVRSKKLELTISKLKLIDGLAVFSIEFRLKNVGQALVKGVTVSFRLPSKVTAKPPEPPPAKIGPYGMIMPRIPTFDVYAFYEQKQDFFETGGAVACCDPLPKINPVLLPGHSTTLEGLGFPFSHYPKGTSFEIEYRLDAEEMEPVTGSLSHTVPDSVIGWILQDREGWGFDSSSELAEMEAYASKVQADLDEARRCEEYWDGSGG
jgi:hypothetical protein